jgi:hypothetical protein
VAQGYKDVRDPSVYVALDLESDERRETSAEPAEPGAGDPAARPHLCRTTSPVDGSCRTRRSRVNPGLAYVRACEEGGGECSIVRA